MGALLSAYRLALVVTASAIFPPADSPRDGIRPLSKPIGQLIKPPCAGKIGGLGPRRCLVRDSQDCDGVRFQTSISPVSLFPRARSLLLMQDLVTGVYAVA
jgi:hypothetical protein